jgi:peptidoglycan/xylan/chitin deacetylase (PgdA/CDA1 family)
MAIAAIAAIAAACSGKTVSEHRASSAVHLSSADCTGAGQWAVGVSYKTGDLVSYGGSVYVCIQSHTSEPGWTPDVVAALWSPTDCAPGSGGGSTSGGGGSTSGGGSGGASSSSGSGSASSSGSSSSGSSGGVGGSCACLNGSCLAPGATPALGFDNQPSYIPNDTIILTFDDVPDSTNTAQVLDILKNRGLHATFFVNTMNYGGPFSLVQRMHDEGHTVANHTDAHCCMANCGPCPGAVCQNPEGSITAVETAIAGLNGVPRPTLFRDPYGVPDQPSNCTASDQAAADSIIARHAVNIGWNFDSGDSDGITDPTALFNNVVMQIKTPGAPGASWGIMLAHAVLAQTVQALPMILDYLQNNHFKIAQVEDALCWAYGAHSDQLLSGGGGGSSGGSASGSSSGGASGSSGGSSGGGSASGSGSGSTSSSGSGGNDPCSNPGLSWKTANETNFTSYPAPGSQECIQFSGCMYEGQFAACSQTESQSWVQAHNIVSVFPDFSSLKLHDLCLKDPDSGQTIVATVLDECADSDCSGCCTQNRGSADELVDVEHFTYQRFNSTDKGILWADLGPTTGSGCN